VAKFGTSNQDRTISLKGCSAQLNNNNKMPTNVGSQVSQADITRKLV
jgi:hypothetical protein